MRTKVKIQITDENNASQGSFVVTFQTERDLDDTVQLIVPFLANKGVLQCEHMEYDFKLHGISFQKGQTLTYKPDKQ